MIRESRYDYPGWHAYTIDAIDVMAMLFAGWLICKLMEWWLLN